MVFCRPARIVLLSLDLCVHEWERLSPVFKKFGKVILPQSIELEDSKLRRGHLKCLHNVSVGIYGDVWGYPFQQRWRKKARLDNKCHHAPRFTSAPAIGTVDHLITKILHRLRASFGRPLPEPAYHHICSLPTRGISILTFLYSYCQNLGCCRPTCYMYQPQPQRSGSRQAILPEDYGYIVYRPLTRLRSKDR